VNLARGSLTHLPSPIHPRNCWCCTDHMDIDGQKIKESAIYRIGELNVKIGYASPLYVSIELGVTCCAETFTWRVCFLDSIQAWRCPEEIADRHSPFFCGHSKITHSKNWYGRCSFSCKRAARARVVVRRFIYPVYLICLVFRHVGFYSEDLD
jgi:hypothetical protein